MRSSLPSSLARRLLIGLCCCSSALFALPLHLLVLLLVVLLLSLLFCLYSKCPVRPFRLPCRTLLFNIFVPLVFAFFYILRIPPLLVLLPPLLPLTPCCCCFCWYYVRAKLLVKRLSGAESLTQFSHVQCTSHDSQTLAKAKEKQGKAKERTPKANVEIEKLRTERGRKVLHSNCF